MVTFLESLDEAICEDHAEMLFWDSIMGYEDRIFLMSTPPNKENFFSKKLRDE